MPIRFLKHRWTIPAWCRLEAAYERHLLAQKYALAKPDLMRYFTMNFFHDGEIEELQYAPARKEFRMVLGSSCAINNACDLLQEKRPGIAEEKVCSLVNARHFLHEVTFTNAEILRMHCRPQGIDDAFRQYELAEFEDAPRKKYPSGSVMIHIRFHFRSSIDMVFQNVRVRPRYPALFKKYFSKKNEPSYSLLKGRNPKDALRRNIQKLLRYAKESYAYGKKTPRDVKI